MPHSPLERVLIVLTILLCNLVICPPPLLHSEHLGGKDLALYFYITRTLNKSDKRNECLPP